MWLPSAAPTSRQFLIGHKEEHKNQGAIQVGGSLSLEGGTQVKLILKPSEAEAMGFPKKEMTIMVPLTSGNKENVICVEGAGIYGVVVDKVRVSMWMKPATGGKKKNKKSL